MKHIHHVEDIINYYSLGYSYMEIRAFLSRLHDTDISIRQIHRILRVNRLKRRDCVDINWNIVVNIVQHELSESGRDCGYRSMQGRLRVKHGLQVDRESI